MLTTNTFCRLTSSLSHHFLDADLRGFFATCGNIVRLSVPRDKQSGMAKGDCEVYFGYNMYLCVLCIVCCLLLCCSCKCVIIIIICQL